MKNLHTNQEVASAIISIIDHGSDCGCSHCQWNNEVIRRNPEISETFAVLLAEQERQEKKKK